MGVAEEDLPAVRADEARRIDGRDHRLAQRLGAPEPGIGGLAAEQPGGQRPRRAGFHRASWRPAAPYRAAFQTALHADALAAAGDLDGARASFEPVKVGWQGARTP